jgi:hypothetical protein
MNYNAPLKAWKSGVWFLKRIYLRKAWWAQINNNKTIRLVWAYQLVQFPGGMSYTTKPLWIFAKEKWLNLSLLYHPFQASNQISKDGADEQHGSTWYAGCILNDTFGRSVVSTTRVYSRCATSPSNWRPTKPEYGDDANAFNAPEYSYGKECRSSDTAPNFILRKASTLY